MSKNDPLERATDFAVKIQACKTIPELEAVGAEIKADLSNLTGFDDWLRDLYFSKLNYDLKVPDYSPEEKWNKAGLKALKKGELSHGLESDDYVSRPGE